MKRFLALAALVLGLAACQTEPEGLDVNVGGEVDTTITVSLPETTRANSALGAFDNVDLKGTNGTDYTVRYIFEVYYGDKGTQKQVYYTDGQSASFPVRLVPNRHYNFVAWADIVEQPTDDNKMNKALPYEDTDVYYETEELTNITIIDSEWVAMDEKRDAFTGFYNTASEGDNNKYTGTSSINIQMTRPFAKLRVLTTDMEDLANIGLEPRKAVIKYDTDHYSSFNACSGTPFNKDIAKKSHTIDDVRTYGESGTLFVDYFFASSTEDETVRFDLLVYDQNGNDDVNKIKYNNFNTDIKVRRNYLTTISGNILTDGNNVKVDVVDAFENVNNGNTTDPNYEYKTISSDKEFLAAVNTPGKYVVISDLHLAKEGDTMTTLATRAGGTTTIDLNGKTITVENKGNGALASVAAGNTLVITNTVDGGKIKLTEGSTGAFIENNGIVVLEGGNLSTETGVTATVINNNGTANITGGELEAGAITNNGTTNVEDGVINEGAIVNTTNGTTEITGGEFTYNPSDDVPEGFEAKEENGKYIVTECEPVAKIGDVEYTTIKATFEAVENGQTIILQRDVETKSTAVLTEGKTVVLDLGGHTLSATDKNVIRNDGGNLTIMNGTIGRTGDVVGYSVNNASGEITVENATITRGLYTSGSKMTATNANISHEQSSRHAIYAWNCEVTINSGTYHNDNAGNATLMASGSSVVTINGGTFSIADGRETLTWTSCLMDQNGTAKITVKDGKFNGGFRINSADTTLTIEGGEFNTNNGSGYTYYNGTVSIKGGTYTDAAAIAFAEKYVAEGYMAVDNGDNTSTVIMPAAKVGSTIYTSIDEAIAAWTNNSTLTLLNNVTLSDVVDLNSTEHHILNLSTYTMTAAEGKNAFEIIARGTGASERTAITIKADANNPGSIDAGSKSVVYYNYANGTATGDDRPIIKIEGGIFRGATSSFGTAGIYFKGGSAARHAATLNISGGEFYCSINGQSKSKLLITGGLFHYSVGSQGDSTAHRLISGGTFKTLGFMTADSNNTKFWFGTSMANSNVGLYINDDNYLVVGGPVITEFGDKFAAKATNATKWNSLLQYSSAATNGLYYTNADLAISKHGEANVVLK